MNDQNYRTGLDRFKAVRPLYALIAAQPELQWLWSNYYPGGTTCTAGAEFKVIQRKVRWAQMRQLAYVVCVVLVIILCTALALILPMKSIHTGALILTLAVIALISGFIGKRFIEDTAWADEEDIEDTWKTKEFSNDANELLRILKLNMDSSEIRCSNEEIQAGYRVPKALALRCKKALRTLKEKEGEYLHAKKIFDRFCILREIFREGYRGRHEGTRFLVLSDETARPAQS